MSEIIRYIDIISKKIRNSETKEKSIIFESINKLEAFYQNSLHEIKENNNNLSNALKLANKNNNSILRKNKPHNYL